MMTRYCCDAMHEADPDVHAVVNTCFMFGENAADGRTQWGPTWERNLVPFSAIERLEEQGVQYKAITMWSMADPGYVPASGLFTEDFRPKESFFRLKELEKSWGFDFGRNR